MKAPTRPIQAKLCLVGGNRRTVTVSLPAQLNGGINPPSGLLNIGTEVYRILCTYSVKPLEVNPCR